MGYMSYTRETGYTYSQVTSVLYQTEAGKNVTGDFVFRKRADKVEVMVVKEIESPEYATNFKPIMQRMQDFSKVLQGVTMETRIRVTDEYGYDNPSAVMVLKGWKSALNNRERHALTQAKNWF